MVELCALTYHKLDEYLALALNSTNNSHCRIFTEMFAMRMNMFLILGTNQCELTCMGIGFNFYYNFGKVLDGTPCRTTAPIAGGGATVCLNGNCAVGWHISFHHHVSVRDKYGYSQ